MSAEDEAATADILAALDRLSEALWTRDPDFAEHFADSPKTLLIGSESHEVARGRAEIDALARTLFAMPARLRWEWRHCTVSVAGDMAWLFADCAVVVSEDGAEIRKPYRITGVLRRASRGWEWLQFHGSEPAD